MCKRGLIFVFTVISIKSGVMHAGQGDRGSLGQISTNFPDQSCTAIEPSQVQDKLDPLATPKISKFLTKAMQEFSKVPVDGALKLFHPRLKTKLASLHSAQQIWQGSLGKPVKILIHKTWALQNSSGRAIPISCNDGAMILTPLYGYDFQLAVWFELRGTDEFGRIFALVVPHESQWKFGYFQYRKWTHAQKRPVDWLAEADSDLQSTSMLAAFPKYHLALKLISGNPHYAMTSHRSLKKFLKKRYSEEQWLKQIQPLFLNKVLHVGSLFVPDGAGLLVRFLLTKEESSVFIREHCKQSLRKLTQQPWFNLQGLNCSYVMKGEPTDREGQLGGLYMTKDSLKGSR